MTDLSRGARNRRGGRRPGWLLLTVLLVLTIVAGSALVFSSSVELLKLAVVLALWAAVVGAFVSVIYRRQSEADAAKVRDLKLVYDLQLDREISARREYELSVESHLRRELSHELRSAAADEVAALRAELAALRTNLEILFDTDLGHRPALEHEQLAAIENERGYHEPDPTFGPPDRVASSRITATREEYRPGRDEDDVVRTAETPIIDVPEEPLEPVGRSEGRRGSHRRAGHESWAMPPAPPVAPTPPPTPPPAPPVPPPPAHYRPSPPPQPQPPYQRPPEPHVPVHASADAPVLRPAPAPPGPPPAPEPPAHAAGPAMTPPPAPVPPPDHEPAESAPRGRHAGGQQRPGRHAGGASPAPFAGQPEPAPQPQPEPEPEPAGRHRGPESGTPETAAELLARLNKTPGGGGRRRRRED